MSKTKWRRIRRYRDGLIDPSTRLVVTDEGITWVTDRFTLVRADMFALKVTDRSPYIIGLRPASLRNILDRAPRQYVPTRELGRLADGDEEIIVYAGEHGTATPFFGSVEPLLNACDLLRLKGGILYGFQRRPHSHDPVLVCVVNGHRWSGAYLRAVPS